jgi:phenylalanyl-tRNA synthetase beta chain
MKLPYEWIKEYVTFKYSPEELAEVLTLHSLEVSSISNPASQIQNVITGRIVKIEKHPNADRLQICRIDIGQKDWVQIVTGATNIFENAVVPVALAPAKLPMGEIKVGKLRGVESYGMLCSQKELGLADEAAGIYILSDKTVIGKNIVQAIDFPQAVLEVEILPNRPDCLSVIGLAREISAITGNSLRLPKLQPIIKKGTSMHKARVAVRDREECPRYMARMLQHVKVQDSPDWLKQKLIAMGVRPINNVVDITNYVMLEMGQPMHAFDFKKIEGGQINVRHARKGEKVNLLSGKEFEFDGSELVIADKNNVVAMAGVMGATDSAVSNQTEIILLESAYFSSESITKTVRKTGIRSESSLRFEKGVYWEGVEEAMQRATGLLIELAGAEVVSDSIDEKRKDPESLSLDLRFNRARQVLGIDVPVKDMIRILEFLGFRVDLLGDKLNVMVPGFRRVDVQREIDLIEEVARIHGYEHIPQSLPSLGVKVKTQPESALALKKIKNSLMAQGFDEAITYPLTTDKLNLAGVPAVQISNPMAEAHVLRNHLLGNLLQVASHQLAHQIQNVKLFEVGKVFSKIEGSKSQTLPELVFNEDQHIAIVACGNTLEHSFEVANQHPYDFFYLKGVIENLFLQLSKAVPSVHKEDHAWFHPGRVSGFAGTDWVLGEIHPEVLRQFDIKNQKVYAFEGSLQSLLRLKTAMSEFTEIPKQPHSRKDIAILVKAMVQHDQVIKSIQKYSSEIVEKVECFDFYTGKPIPEGFKSLAFAVYYRDPQKTLTDEQILAQHKKIQEGLKKDLAAEIR